MLSYIYKSKIKIIRFIKGILSCCHNKELNKVIEKLHKSKTELFVLKKEISDVVIISAIKSLPEKEVEIEKVKERRKFGVKK